MDRFFVALDTAHRTLDDGFIDELYTRTDEYGYRSILAHSDQGWFTFFSESDDADRRDW